MTSLRQPSHRPGRPQFSCGPTCKHPGWSLDRLRGAVIGRSHRAAPARERMKEAFSRLHALLELPASHRLGMMVGSNTAAFEAALWSLLGERPVDVAAWDAFGYDWRRDVVKELQPRSCRDFVADYGKTVDLERIDCDHDVVFAMNGTSSGTVVPDFDWIPDRRRGLTLVDATSGLFSHPVDWEKIDVASFSWQKGLGAEAAHGMIVLSPRAVARLESYVPDRPIPKLMRLAEGKKLKAGIFDASPINTPSLLCVEDLLSSLDWAEGIGGAPELIRRSQRNAQTLYQWIDDSPLVRTLCENPEWRSQSSVCFRLNDPQSLADPDREKQRAADIIKTLDENDAAYDINPYPTAPCGFRVWTGPTVECDDIVSLTQWLEWSLQSHA